MYVCFTSLGDLRDWLEKWVPSYFHKFESSGSTKVEKVLDKAIYSNTVQKCTKMHGEKNALSPVGLLKAMLELLQIFSSREGRKFGT